MVYFNYHARIDRLLKEGKLLRAVIVKKWNQISPALVLFFSDHPPMPIREYRWQEYFLRLYEMNVTVEKDE